MRPYGLSLFSPESQRTALNRSGNSGVRRTFTVPLVPKALEILQIRKDQVGDSGWVFPSDRRKGKHLVEIKNIWAGILKRAEITDLRMHDLRRSLGSWMAAQGASLTVIGKGLGHKNTSTTAIYSRLNIDPVRTAMEAATSAMIEASGAVADVSKVTPIDGVS
ncbi:MAG: tyrosine-type recombinase/integrase [Chloroflexi bacterium]|nr:tyrosine-type recombinase/integrase [Chloroflexota bacterium]